MSKKKKRGKKFDAAEDAIHGSAASAWRAVVEAGALEPNGRDRDLIAQLREALDSSARTLDDALQNVSTDRFLRVFFATALQPFVAMYSDILAFFKQADARYGLQQWRISVGEAPHGLEDFIEFLKEVGSMPGMLEVPDISADEAWIPNNIRLKIDLGYLVDADGKPTGFEDVDRWFAAYKVDGHIEPFPESLHTHPLEPGLDDMANLIAAAISVLRSAGLETAPKREALWRSVPSVDRRDGFAPASLAQSESDRAIKNNLLYLVALLGKPDDERKVFSEKLREKYAPLKRRRIVTDVEVKSLEKILSLPAWRKRHEYYGVWVATQIFTALEDRAPSIQHKDGRIAFAFSETPIFTIENPRCQLISERRVPLANPVGKSRVNSAQPDYGIWKLADDKPRTCTLVVEVKHYLKPSKSNFSAALQDYAAAHSEADIALVNYAAVGDVLDTVPEPLRGRCHALANLNPSDPVQCEAFHALVRRAIDRNGDTFRYHKSDYALVAFDVSGSMRNAYASGEFGAFLSDVAKSGATIALIDTGVRSRHPAGEVMSALRSHTYDAGTDLAAPMRELKQTSHSILLITDHEGEEQVRFCADMVLVAQAQFPELRFLSSVTPPA